MRSGLVFTILSVASAVSFGIRPSAFGIRGQSPLSADQVARQVQDRDTGRDSRALLRMRLVDRRGRARERTLELTAREGGTAGDRSLVRFTYPNDIKGTAFLVWEHPGKEDERFLYLPSLGRIRRIAGDEAQESFVGTDFTYEDIGGREFDDYTYRFAGENAFWESPDGRKVPAYRLESRRKDVRASFPRVLSLVSKDSFVICGAGIFNRRDERQKVYAVRKLERVEDIWTVLDSTMSDEPSDTRTDLAIEKIDYNIGLTEADFSRRVLERAP
jgi:Outer membrane lipoprotein-sorting protein